MIIVAAIALIVLIVLVVIFTGRLDIFSKEYTDVTEDAKAMVCGSMGGTCIKGDNCGSMSAVTPVPSGGWIDCSDSQICCESS